LFKGLPIGDETGQRRAGYSKAALRFRIEYKCVGAGVIPELASGCHCNRLAPE
jgi:hypothetical protein